MAARRNIVLLSPDTAGQVRGDFRGGKVAHGKKVLIRSLKDRVRMQAFAPAMTLNSERRKKRRNSPQSLLYVELEYENGGMMRDLSEDGFALRAKMPLRVGRKTPFAFSLDEGARISGEGRIVWVKEGGGLAGIEFCGISRSAREQIRRWLERSDRPGGREPKVPAIAEFEPSKLETPREEIPAVEAVGIALPGETEMAPGSEMQRELRDVSPERFRVGSLEPLPAPLPEIEFSGKAAEHPAGRFRVGRAIGMILLLALIGGAVIYHRQVGHALVWLGEIIAGPEEARVPQALAPEAPAQAAPVPVVAGPVSSPAVPGSSIGSAPQGDRVAPSETQPAPASKVIEAPSVVPAKPPVSEKTPSTPAPPPEAEQDRTLAPDSSHGTASDTGQEAYQQAEQILRSQGSEAELPVGVRLLWSAVEKGNADAEVALAELYRDGKGVARNCDQARILLTAAARKGSAEAHKHLEELVRKGCR